MARERELWGSGCRYVVGVDEVGRGCLAGPVVAAAVVLPPEVRIRGVRDSKVLTADDRESLARLIRKKAISFGVGACTPREIDHLNILWAAMEAMRRAVAGLDVEPHFLLIDGNTCFPHSPWPYKTVVGGDAVCHSIAAASVIAKVSRDRLMHDLHNEYPAYCWHTNVGYPTPEHFSALAEHGPTPHHRRSFNLRVMSPQKSLFPSEQI